MANTEPKENDMDGQQADISAIPNELLHEIFEWIPRLELARPRLTCRRFNQLARPIAFDELRLEVARPSYQKLEDAPRKLEHAVRKLEQWTIDPVVAGYIQCITYVDQSCRWVQFGDVPGLLHNLEPLLAPIFGSIGFDITDQVSYPFFVCYLRILAAASESLPDMTEEAMTVRARLSKCVNVKKLIIILHSFFAHFRTSRGLARAQSLPAGVMTSLTAQDIDWSSSGDHFNRLKDSFEEEFSYFEALTLYLSLPGNSTDSSIWRDDSHRYNGTWLAVLLKALPKVKWLSISIPRSIVYGHVLFTLEQATNNVFQWPRLLSLTLNGVTASYESMKAVLCAHRGTLLTLRLRNIILNKGFENRMVRNDLASKATPQCGLRLLHDLPQWTGLE